MTVGQLGAPVKREPSLVSVRLPGGAEVAFPPDTYAFVHHQIWVLDGRLRFVEGTVTHELGAGDCLELGPPVYNQGVRDASSFIQDKLTDIEGEVYERETP